MPCVTRSDRRLRNSPVRKTRTDSDSPRRLPLSPLRYAAVQKGGGRCFVGRGEKRTPATRPLNSPYAAPSSSVGSRGFAEDCSKAARASRADKFRRRRECTGQRRIKAALGCPSLWFLSLGHARERNWPPGYPRPASIFYSSESSFHRIADERNEQDRRSG